MADHRIRSVVVLGGGTAGWMTACYLAKALHETVDVTVLEAPAIPRIGVGEATIPNLQTAFFDFLGVPEDEWMRECGASFKLGIKFVNWRTPGMGFAQPREFSGGEDYFYHIFGQLPTHDGLPLSHYWVHRHQTGLIDEPFDRACYRETLVMDANRAPRTLDGLRMTNYAWHFDANRVADYLRRFAVEKQSVRHVPDVMTRVRFDQRGYITALETQSGQVLEGDLFVDCSGFRGLLINQAMGEPFVDMSDYLLCDSAVATGIQEDGAEHGIEPYTSAIAMEAGWTWKIPMLTRFGTGYVFSSKFTSRDRATVDFCRLWGLDPETTPLNQISFRVGRNRRAWVKNCVGIGLASCFVEPLESTGIYFTYAAVHQLVKHFPDKRFHQTLVDRFNREIEIMFDDTRDFIQAHFRFSPRTDTPFWRANKEITLADDIAEKISTYRAGLPLCLPPTDDDGDYYHNLDIEFRNFWTNSNYYCIFAGLGFLPDNPLPILAHRPSSVRGADVLFAEVKQEQRRLLDRLPSNYEYLRRLHAGSL